MSFGVLGVPILMAWLAATSSAVADPLGPADADAASAVAASPPAVSWGDAEVEPVVPPALRPWIQWVLEDDQGGQDQRACPIDPTDGERRCVWPGPLVLELDATGGSFAQTWEVRARSWVPLPGDPEIWPLGVQVAGMARPVLLRDGRPAVRLEPGVHHLSGRFSWDPLPDALPLPPLVGLVELSRDGEPVLAPRLDRSNRLWLGEPAQVADEVADAGLSLEVHRLIEDRLPLEVSTRLELESSGPAREVRLGPVLLSGGIPLRLVSPLPARLEEDGTLRVQVRPGRWVLEIASHHPGAITALSRVSAPPPWPEQELWAFAAQPELRRVELSGVTPIDPRQTGLPADWRVWPVYRVGPSDLLSLTEQGRGDADPAPERLRLERRLWLDFDGSGYSVQDRISGQMSRAGRLDAGPRLELGQVLVGGQPVLITRLDTPDALAGVEVRGGRLEALVDARIASPASLVPASGWALDLAAVEATLELPPGWDLLMVRGVDNQPETWVGRWTLLDLFLVLILALGIGRLWGWGWGLLALVALGLTWQIPSAPRLVWLHLLAAAALLRLVPVAPERTGLRRLRGLLLVYFRLSLLALLVVGLPFVVSEVRDGLFPHLERPGASLLHPGSGRAAALARLPEMTVPSAAQEFAAERAFDTKREHVVDALTETLGTPPEPLVLIDPTARLQTGPGIPDWRWHSQTLRWVGPVGEQEAARLWLLTPTWSLILSLCGVLLLILLGLRLSGLRVRHPKSPIGMALLVLVGLGTTLGQGPAIADDLPSPQLLQELRSRLLAPPDCLPACLDLPHLRLVADPERLVIEMTFDAAVAVAAPLPLGAGGWRPRLIERVGLSSAGPRRGPRGELTIPLPAGRHQIRLAGPLAGHDQVEIPLPMPPRVMEHEVAGWTLEGVDAQGRPGAQLRLIRHAAATAPPQETLAQEVLPPLLRVERLLRMRADWRLETHVRRLSPPEYPVLVAVPLWPGEQVRTPGVQVEGETVLVDLPAGQTELSWSSRLEPVDLLHLRATTDPRLSEDWRLDVGTLWHLEHSGPAPVHPREHAAQSLPSWRPLPGETLHLHITRPVAVPGPTLTIDRAQLVFEPGHRGTLGSLTLAMRSSQGVSHGIRLPAGAELLTLTLDGRGLPLPDTVPQLLIPVSPGAAALALTWRDSGPLGLSFSPSMPDLGSPAVNLEMAVRLPQDRWVLGVWGPRIGPAVLFWGSLLVLIGLAAALGRSRLTPLRVHDWLLLGMGLILAQLWVGLVVVGWLFALGLRRGLDPQDAPPWRFNLLQIGLVVLTLLALAGLLDAVQQGLLGSPEMQIMGNGSSANHLNWYQDRTGPGLPSLGVLSVPLWVYRALMLAWALWLAVRLLDWLRWGWEGFSRPMLWREIKLARMPNTPAPGARPAAPDPWLASRDP
ncbi:MAG: hypothetical protein EOM91_04470 [Sphingobacteriia bacterium]|nr:hypothetical protein [Sphingobacteriia bacterium]NCC39127.1 hypothetical protein [Gammaproteobacteria bacterium]